MEILWDFSSIKQVGWLGEEIEFLLTVMSWKHRTCIILVFIKPNVTSFSYSIMKSTTLEQHNFQETLKHAGDKSVILHGLLLCTYVSQSCC